MIRALLVDDEPDILEVVELALRMEGGFVVAACTSGAKAIARARDFRPEVLLLDYRMPKMLGTEVLARLRRINGLETVPAFFLTVQIDEASKAALRASGADGVIDKPFDPVTLGARIKALLDRVPPRGLSLVAC